MKLSTLLAILASLSSVLGAPAKLIPPGSEIQLVERGAAPKSLNYSYEDPIERDIDVNCYHYPKPRKGSTTGYRKCYMKKDPCNIKWRHDIQAYRAACIAKFINNIQPIWVVQDPDNPICRKLWEPDIESLTYCGGKDVKEDGKGNRVPPCGKPHGIGEGSCRAPVLGGCAVKEECELLEPDQNFDNSDRCRAMWSHCDRMFVKLCPDYALPCQDKCGDPKTCIRGYPPALGLKAHTVRVVDWDMVEEIKKSNEALNGTDLLSNDLGLDVEEQSTEGDGEQLEAEGEY